jgi:outer membrane protein assembly factor BamA
LYERQTGFSFLMEYSEIEKSLFETGEFELIYEEENGSNPLQFYLRVKPFVAPS